LSYKHHRLREHLDKIYVHYNRREYVHPDPLEFLWRYSSIEDREITGLIASGLAYGRVAQILKSTEKVLKILGPSPSGFLKNISLDELKPSLAGFKHRFTTASEMAAVIKSASLLQEKWGLLGNMLVEYLEKDDYHDALDKFVVAILEGADLGKCSLLPRPQRGSACKRLHLFMRWMVRRDEVDPGGWDRVLPSVLTVPLDVHMFRIAKFLGFTRRQNASCTTASEVTEGFRRINPEDPVKYDFSLTRMGILGLQKDALFRELFTGEDAFIDSKS